MTSLLVRDPLFAEPFRLMNQLFGGVGGDGGSVTGWVPAMDVRETTDEYLAFVDLPGVKSQDVAIEVNDRVLSISGTRMPVETGETQQLERPHGSFVRNLTLPAGIDADSIAADYSAGVLTLRIPKPADAKPKRMAIGGATQKAIGR
jgi:HSP20 family protein